MSDWNKTLYPIPDKSNAIRMKEFLKLKYEARWFMDREISEQIEEGKDPDKIVSKKKKKHQAEKEDDSEEDEESDGEVEEKKKYKKSKGHKLSKPESVVSLPHSQVQIETEKSTQKWKENRVEKKEEVRTQEKASSLILETPQFDPLEEQRRKNAMLLEMDFGSAPIPASKPEMSN